MKRFTLAKIIIILIVSLLTVIWVNANADETVNHAIGIAFSRTYLEHLKIEPSLHPNYEDLIKLNLDNSNRKVTGDFKIIDGIMQRELPTMIKHWSYYTYNEDYLLFVDPPSDMRNKLRMIIIESNLDVYLNKDQMNKIDNIRYYNIDRWINPNCSESVIGANDYLNLLADTIHLMRLNCDYSKSTFNHKRFVTDNATAQDIATSQKFKQDQWQKMIKESHVKLKINSDNSTNKSVTEDKAPKYVPPKTPPFNYTKYK